MRLRIRSVMAGIAGLAPALAFFRWALRGSHDPALLAVLMLAAGPFLLPTAFVAFVVVGTLLDVAGEVAARSRAAGRGRSIPPTTTAGDRPPEEGPVPGRIA